jgi:hypothetical protein
MKNYTRILTILFLALLTFVMSATAQTNDNKNKAIVETTDGTQQLNTDEISIIRFDGDKVTFVQPWGESVFDRTLRSLTFLRPLPGTLRLTVNAGINENSSNRAQVIDEGKLKTTWESGDVVYVYADESSTTPLGTLTPAPADYGSSSATLVGDITGTGLADGTPTLYFSTQPRSTYSLATQDGTVESLFYCTATASVTINGGNATISGTLDFNRPISVVKFKLMDKGNGNAAINADKLVVTVDGNSYTVTPAVADDELFVGIPSFSDKTVYLTANEGSTVYTYEKTSVSFAENKYYAINVKMSYNALSTPLNFEAKADGFTVTLTSTLDSKPSLQYSIDGGTWTDFTFSGDVATTSSVNTGHTISFRGNNSRYFIYDGSAHTSNFTCSQDCYLYGNMMSLLSASSYATATSVGESAFLSLFEDNTNIYSHDTKALVLPATMLARSCYEGLFIGCSHLTTAPNLPATTLAEYCYSSMFRGCTGLVTAPAISAETLAAHCCEQMFKGCTSLTTGPTLSATTLTDYCYMIMFQNCSNLNSVTCLAATNLSAESCTSDWLDGVAATGTFAKAPSMTSWTTDSSSGIPSGWTSKNAVNLTSLTEDYVAQDNVVLTGTLAGNYKISIADGATVMLNNVDINGSGTWTSGDYAGITCVGDATIILSGANSVKGFDERYPGIYVPTSKTVTIQGTGSLTASSTGYAPGIGCAYLIDCGNIIIEGGTITATGGMSAAGIGGSYRNNCGNITISGGTITATGGDNAAGIGSGWECICGNITISGGTVTATGGKYGAGIGGGYKGNCGNISITGGTIEATGGQHSAGIGGGQKNGCGNIEITDGVTSVTAIKGIYGSYSIGEGLGGSCGTVTIGGVEGAITESPYTYTPPVPSAPTGAIDGLFSVSSTKQVYFSQGNLQAVFASAGISCTWQFAEHQYDYIGGRSNGGSGDLTGNNYINGNGSVSTAGAVDLFSWSTNATYYGIHNSDNASTYSGAFYDWGNAIGSGWRTLTKAEWVWVLGPSEDTPDPDTNCRTSSTVNGVENARYAKATVVGKAGLIIFPDSYTHPGDVTAPESVNAAGAAYTANSYDATAWGKMEAAGAVFLPAAGIRPAGINNYVLGCEVTGGYWSSVPLDDQNAYFLLFQPIEVTPSGYNPRNTGCSVRLVKDAD